MGIKSQFNKFLRDTCPEIFEDIHISTFAFKRVAIDISLYINKYKAIAGDNWLASFINLMACLRRNEIHSVFIFDGKSPPEKEGERLKRRQAREKMENELYKLELAYDNYCKTGIVDKCLSELYERRRSPQRLLGQRSDGVDMEWVENKIKQKRNQLYEINPEDYTSVKELFDILHVPYYTAPWEAEKTCSKLCIDGKVSAVLSEDTDVMAYGTPVFLSKLDTSKDTCVCINQDALLSSLNLNKEQFLDLCIMCGTDYNDNIFRVGSKTAYKHIINHENIEGISSKTDLDISVLKHVRVRQLFTEFEEYDIDSVPYCGCPNFEELERFIITKKIQVNIEKLRKDFTQNIVIFEDSDEETEVIISDED